MQPSEPLIRACGLSALLCVWACHFDATGRASGTSRDGADIDATPAFVDAAPGPDATLSDGPGTTTDAPSCGQLNTACCAGDQCPGSTTDVPLFCDGDSHTCQLCGVSNQRCCMGDTCPASTASAPLLCDTSPDPHQCVPCGLSAQRCCGGDMCPGSTTTAPLFCNTSPDPHQCVACGQFTQVCCPGGTCIGGLRCHQSRCD